MAISFHYDWIKDKGLVFKWRHFEIPTNAIEIQKQYPAFLIYAEAESGNKMNEHFGTKPIPLSFDPEKLTFCDLYYIVYYQVRNFNEF